VLVALAQQALVYNFDKEHNMAGMNYSRTTNRHIANHTINPRWTTGKAYRPELNSPVTVIKADGTKVVEKPLGYDEINKVNKIKKKRKRNKRKAKFVHVNEVIKREIAREHAVKDREQALEEYKQRQKALKPKPVETKPMIVSSVAPVKTFHKKVEKQPYHKAETEFKATRTPSPEWLARKAEQEAAAEKALAKKKLLPWEGKHDSR
jgi:hypothetical protein